MAVIKTVAQVVEILRTGTQYDMYHDPALDDSVVHFESEQKPSSWFSLDVPASFLAIAIKATYCLEVKKRPAASGCEWRNLCAATSESRRASLFPARRAWRSPSRLIVCLAQGPLQ